MKENLYHKVKALSNAIPMEFYIRTSGQKMLLPFYHAVTDFPKPHLSEIGYFRTKKMFLEDINFLQKNYKSIPIEKLNDCSQNNFHLTFDDGLSEVYTEILPILIKENIHATFFVNTDFIDNKKMFYRHKLSLILHHLKQNQADAEVISGFLEIENNKVLRTINSLKDEQQINEIADLLKIDFENYLKENQPYLTTNQLLEIKNQGFVIGNHSQNHPNFRDISFAEQQNQINVVNRYLQTQLGVKNLYFSFPFGDENIKNEFFDFMYNHAKIIYSFGVSGLKTDEYRKHLHRIPMEENYSAEQILKFEYFYYMLKSFVGKNKKKR